MTKNIIIDVKVQETCSINWFSAARGCSLKMDDNWALVTDINCVKSINQYGYHISWYPINPSIAAVNGLFSCEDYTKSSLLDITTC